MHQPANDESIELYEDITYARKTWKKPSIPLLQEISKPK